MSATSGPGICRTLPSKNNICCWKYGSAKAAEDGELEGAAGAAAGGPDGEGVGNGLEEADG